MSCQDERLVLGVESKRNRRTLRKWAKTTAAVAAIATLNFIQTLFLNL
jgi:hypothetical protein